MLLPCPRPAKLGCLKWEASGVYITHQRFVGYGLASHSLGASVPESHRAEPPLRLLNRGASGQGSLLLPPLDGVSLSTPTLA
jgi:hypothetical protein